MAVFLTFWTDEKTAECHRLLLEGKSGLAIAVIIGAPSRNSVISKIHRSGWTGPNSRGSSNKPPTNPRRRPVPPRPATFNFKRRQPPPQPKPQAVEAIDQVLPTQYDVSFAEGGPKILLHLQRDDCRYPIGDPRKADFCFCAAQRVGKWSPYCANHTRIAYEPPQERKKY